MSNDIEQVFSIPKRRRNDRLERFFLRGREIELIKRHEIRNIQRSVQGVDILLFKLKRTP